MDAERNVMEPAEVDEQLNGDADSHCAGPKDVQSREPQQVIAVSLSDEDDDEEELQTHTVLQQIAQRWADATRADPSFSAGDDIAKAEHYQRWCAAQSIKEPPMLADVRAYLERAGSLQVLPARHAQGSPLQPRATAEVPSAPLAEGTAKASRDEAVDRSWNSGANGMSTSASSELPAQNSRHEETCQGRREVTSREQRIDGFRRSRRRKKDADRIFRLEERPLRKDERRRQLEEEDDRRGQAHPSDQQDNLPVGRRDVDTCSRRRAQREVRDERWIHDSEEQLPSRVHKEDSRRRWRRQEERRIRKEDEKRTEDGRRWKKDEDKRRRDDEERHRWEEEEVQRRQLKDDERRRRKQEEDRQWHDDEQRRHQQEEEEKKRRNLAGAEREQQDADGQVKRREGEVVSNEDRDRRRPQEDAHPSADAGRCSPRSGYRSTQSSAGAPEDQCSTGESHRKRRRRGTGASPPRNSNEPENASQDYRALLQKLYEKHNPAKLGDVDWLLEKYAGREAEMYQRICDKYGVSTASQDLFRRFESLREIQRHKAGKPSVSRTTDNGKARATNTTVLSSRRGTSSSHGTSPLEGAVDLTADTSGRSSRAGTGGAASSEDKAGNGVNSTAPGSGTGDDSGGNPENDKDLWLRFQRLKR